MSLFAWLSKKLELDVYVLAKNSSLSMGSKLVTMAFGFVLVVLYARYVDPAVYGSYLLVASWISLFAMTSLVGMYKALSNAIAKGYEGSLIPIFKKKLSWSLLGAFGMVVTSFFYLESQPTIAYAMLVMAPVVPFFYSTSIWQAFAEGKQRFDMLAKWMIAIATVKTIGIIALIFLTNITVSYLLLANIGIEALLHGIVLIHVWKHAQHKKIDADADKYGVFLSALNIIVKISDYLDTLLLGSVLGPIQLAIYGYAKFIPENIVVLMKAVENVVFPRMAQFSMNDILKKIKKTVPFLLSITVILLIIAIFLIPPVMKIAFNNRYNESIFPAQIMTAALFMVPFEILMHQLLLSHRKKEMLTFVNITKSIVKIAITIIFFMVWGFMGILFMHFASRGFNLLLYTAIMARAKR